MILFFAYRWKKLSFTPHSIVWPLISTFLTNKKKRERKTQRWFNVPSSFQILIMSVGFLYIGGSI